MEKISSCISLVAKGYRTMTWRCVWQGAPYFRGYGLNLLSKQTGDFVIESWGGYRKMIPKLYMVASVSA